MGYRFYAKLMKWMRTFRLAKWQSFNLAIWLIVIAPISDLESLKNRRYKLIDYWRQPTGSSKGPKPPLKPCKICHVDVPAWPCNLRVAPSRTSPISTIRSQDMPSHDVLLITIQHGMTSFQLGKQVLCTSRFTQQLLIPAWSRFLVWGTTNTPILPVSKYVIHR